MIRDIKDWISASDCVKKQALRVNWNGENILNDGNGNTFLV